MQKRGDDVLGEVILLLLGEPREVLVLQLQVVELLVEAVQWLGVALLVDQALTLSQSLLKLDFAHAKLLDAVNFFDLLETCHLIYAGLFFVSELSGFLNA